MSATLTGLYRGRVQTLAGDRRGSAISGQLSTDALDDRQRCIGDVLALDSTRGSQDRAVDDSARPCA